MPTPRETILAALHARLAALPATALRGDVLPETITPEWSQDFTDAQHKAYLRRIGNMTLLGKKLNSKVANNPFADKQKEYAKSEIKMSADLCDQATWTPADIDARQAAFAKRAVKIWSPKPR